MLLDALKRLTSGPKPAVLVLLLLLASLYLMSDATQNSAVFGELYSLLLAVNIAALVLMVALILRNLISVIHQYRQRATGSRLTVRLLVVFILLAVAPVSVVYYFSLQFLQRGIDSWFDVHVEQALEDALELGKTSLDGRLRELLRQTRQLGAELTAVSEGGAALVLNDLRRSGDASELTLMTLKGRVIASSSTDLTEILPNLPGDAVLLQLRQGLDYARLEPLGDRGLQVRIAVIVGRSGPDDARVLHALYPVADRLNRLADSVQSAYADYKELAYLRQPLKYSFILTLSLVLLLSLLAAVWTAFFSARRLVAPIRDLAEGTRAVAEGDYDKRLPLPSRDELGFLVRSFNEMTRKLAQARDSARRSQQEAEEQHAYLEAVLGRLSSGVLTLDDKGILRTVNAAASQILGAELEGFVDAPLQRLGEAHPGLEPLIAAIGPEFADGSPEWRAEVTLFGSKGRQLLMCRGAPLPGIGDIRGGHVIVFDDVTTLIQAQRDAAWGEVARRLAHEIKNPLTPIQLSAERLRHKYLNKMDAEDAEVLDRSTHTIVQQVEAMKEMVKAFSDYANSPKMHAEPVDLNRLVNEVLELYRGDHRLTLGVVLDAGLPWVEADAARLRQVMHNLIRNSVEAVAGERTVAVHFATRCATDARCSFVELTVEDDGPGIPANLFANLFEPYVTGKTKGTGLGLAIVKKIVEEHGGVIWAENPPEGGARLTIRLPTKSQVTSESDKKGA